MKESDIIDAYIKIRKMDNTIPDEVLDFMKDSAVNAIRKYKAGLYERFSRKCYSKI